MDTEAWMTSTVQAHGGTLWRLVRRLGVPADDVADVVQAVFLVAFNKRERIEPGRERAFLIQVAVREAAHARRSLGRRREVLLEDIAIVDESDSAEEQLERKRLRALLDVVLDQIPEEQRTVFVLHELEQLTLRQIAEALEVPEGTASTRLRRAKQLFEQEAKRVRARLARSSAEGEA